MTRPILRVGCTTLSMYWATGRQYKWTIQQYWGPLNPENICTWNKVELYWDQGRASRFVPSTTVTNRPGGWRGINLPTQEGAIDCETYMPTGSSIGGGLLQPIPKAVTFTCELHGVIQTWIQVVQWNTTVFWYNNLLPEQIAKVVLCHVYLPTGRRIRGKVCITSAVQFFPPAKQNPFLQLRQLQFFRHLTLTDAVSLIAL